MFRDWRYRYSRMFLSGGKWWFLLEPYDDIDDEPGAQRWHWWNPAHLVRMGIHWLWVRKYW